MRRSAQPGLEHDLQAVIAGRVRDRRGDIHMRGAPVQRDDEPDAVVDQLGTARQPVIAKRGR